MGLGLTASIATACSTGSAGATRAISAAVAPNAIATLCDRVIGVRCI